MPLSPGLEVGVGAIGNPASKTGSYFGAGDTNVGISPYRIVEKGPQIAHCGQLQRETEAVMFAATATDLRKIVVVQMEEAAQLVRGRRRRIVSVDFTLRGAEETDRHAGRA